MLGGLSDTLIVSNLKYFCQLYNGISNADYELRKSITELWEVI